MKKKTGMVNTTEQIQKREKFVTGLIITTSIIIGILIALLFTGILDFFH